MMFALKIVKIIATLTLLCASLEAAPSGNHRPDSSLYFQGEQQFRPHHESLGFFGNLGHKLSSYVSKKKHSLSGVANNFVYCEACQLGVSLVQSALERNASRSDIMGVLDEICKKFHIESERVCNGLADEFSPEIFTVLAGVKMTSSQLCNMLVGDSCGSPYDPWTNWNVTLPSKPQPRPVYPTPPKKGSPTFRVLHLTDIHYDVNYTAGSLAACNEPLCCRANSGTVKNPSDGAWKYGDYRNCDTPLETLENLFAHLAKENSSFDYIIWTGDLPAHDIWNQPREAQLAALHHAVNLILKYFPGKPVYPSLGNHESSPVDSFPPPFIKGDNSISWLFDALADTWQNWLPKGALDSVRKGAYYTVSPHVGFRIVSLNMNYCNNMNWWLLLNATDPAQELQWLVNTLQAAEDAGEKVHIIGHIPPGIVDCLEAWSWNYYRIVSRYQNIIAGQFFGHTHTDSFAVFYDVETLKIPVSVAYVAPSVTPYSDLNMGYRFYTVDGVYKNSSYQVVDHSTHILNLERANTEGNITWELEYTAKAAYNMSSLLPKDWDKVINTMKIDNSVLDKYNKFYKKSRTDGACDANCRQALLCEARSGRSHDPSLCHDLGVKGKGHYLKLMNSQPKHC